MTTDDVHALAAAYALNALPPQEATAFETHLDDCAACRAEVASFQATTVRLSELAEEAPPADMKANVVGMITSVRQDPPPAVTDAEPATSVAPRAGAPAAEADASIAATTDASTTSATATTAAGTSTSRGTALANRLGLGLAAGLLIVAGALGLWANGLNTQLQERNDQAQQVAAVLAMDGAQTIHKDGTTLVVSPDDRAVLASAQLTQPGEGQVMQVWVIGADGPVSAGLMEDPSSPKLLDIPVQAGETVGVTIEPAGGSDQPTSDPIWAAEV